MTDQGPDLNGVRRASPVDKRERHKKILDVLQRQVVRTQQDLLEALGRVGVSVTQATISRDIKDLGLRKILGRDGLHRYTAPGANPVRRERWAATIQKLAVAVERSGNMVVVQTLPAQASPVAEAILGLGVDGVLGVFPYGSNVLVVGDDDGGAERASERLRGFLP